MPTVWFEIFCNIYLDWIGGAVNILQNNILIYWYCCHAKVKNTTHKGYGILWISLPLFLQNAFLHPSMYYLWGHILDVDGDCVDRISKCISTEFQCYANWISMKCKIRCMQFQCISNWILQAWHAYHIIVNFFSPQYSYWSYSNQMLSKLQGWYLLLF